MASPSTSPRPPALEWNPTLRGVVSLLIFMHFFCVFVVLSSNNLRSPLQQRLVRVFGFYTQLLNFDPDFTPYYFIEGARTDDCAIAIDLYADHEKPATQQPLLKTVTLPDRGSKLLDGQKRYLALGRLVVENNDPQNPNDDVTSLIARAVGARIMSENQARRCVVRCLQRTSQPIALDGLLPNFPRDRPDDPAYDIPIYEADVWFDDDNQVQAIKRSARNEVAPAKEARKMLLKHQAETTWEEWTGAIGESWNQFWFAKRWSQQLAVVRILTGLVTLLYFIGFANDYARWLGPNGILPLETVRELLQDRTRSNYHYSLLTFANGSTELMIFEGLGLVGAACLTIGVFSRVSAAVTLTILLSFIHRVPMISCLGEPVLSMLLFYLCFVPSGEWFGVDAWLRRRKTQEDPQPSVLANLGTRLLQVHLVAFVVMMGMSKLSRQPWWEGDALWYLIAQTRSRPVDLTGLRASPFVLNAWAHAIVAFECLFPILVWNRFARPILLIVGPLLWLSLGIVSGHLILALGLCAASAVFWQWSDAHAARSSLP